MILFYLLITQMPLDQDPTWGKFMGAATLIKYLGLVCVLYAVIHVAMRRYPPGYLSTIQARLFLVYFFLSSASYWLMGPEFSLRASSFISLLGMTFLFFVVLSIVDTLPRLGWTLLAVVASMGWASLFVIREWMRDPQWRPGSIAGDANYFAADACLVLPLAFVLARRSSVLWIRIFAWCCLVATIGSTILGGSRGGLIGLAAAFFWLFWQSPRRLRSLVIMLIFVTPPLLLVPKSPLRRFISPDYSDMLGKKLRIAAWKSGLRMVEHRPLTGIGLGEFKTRMDNYADPGVNFSSIAHNTYLEVAAETGLPNFLVFVGMLFFTYRTFSRVRRRTSDSGPQIVYLAATGLQAGFVGYLVGIFFLSAEYLKLFWLWMFLSMVLPSFLPVRVAEQEKIREFSLISIDAAPERPGP